MFHTDIANSHDPYIGHITEPAPSAHKDGAVELELNYSVTLNFLNGNCD